MPSVILTHGDGSTDTIDETTEPPGGGYNWLWQREIGEMDKLKIRVDRAAAKAASPETKVDSVELSGIHTGRLVDIEKGGPVWTLVVYGFEWDANRHAPTAGGVLRTQTDKAHMDQFINSVSEWSIGTTNAFTGAVDYVFNHALAHEGMRRVEANSPGELRWRADGSVDYLDRLGSDKSASITLAPSNGNVVGDMKVVSRGRTMDATHVRLIGAHEGEAQIETNLVPSGDSGNFTNEVTYSNPRWSSSSDTDWTRWSNKDLTTQAAIDAAAGALADELVDPHVEVKAAVEGEDLVLGDTVHVTKADADIDRDMRVKRITTRQSGARVWDEVLLSTRNLARDTEKERARDQERYNVAFQGSAVWGTPSGGYQAVTSTENYRLTFFYPDVAFEHVAELYVESQPYRTFHSGAASGGTTTSDLNSEFAKISDRSQSLSTLSTSTSWQTRDSWSPNLTTSAIWVIGDVTAASNVGNIKVRITDGTDFWPDSDGVGEFGSTNANDYKTFFTIGVPIDIDTDTLDLQTQSSQSGNTFALEVNWNAWSTHSHTIDPHTHAVDPGVSSFPDTTASGVDVLVNGSQVATDIGSGSFETTVDITGDLTKGAFNTVELTSDSTGWLYATAGLEAYRQIGKN